MAEQAVKKKVPESYEKNAPRFDGEHPDDLLQFLDHIERMMELEATPADKKNAFVARYTERRTGNEWRSFASFSKSYADFKKEILENYPSSVDTERGSLRKLRKQLAHFEPGDITQEDNDDVMALIRVFSAEGAKLISSGILSNTEALPLFFDKLAPSYRDKILEHLDRSPPTRPADADQEAFWTLEEVMNEAKAIAQRQEKYTEFLRGRSGLKSTSGRSMSPRPVKKEATEREASAMLEEIKSAVVNMMDRVEAQAKQKFSDIDQAARDKLTEMETFYKSLPGVARGAPDSQTLPPRPTVKFRPVSESDLCLYCRLPGHWQ